MQFKVSVLFVMTGLATSTVAICNGYAYGIANTGAIANGIGTCQSYNLVVIPNRDIRHG
jgi:hypothetical protein